MSNQKSKPYATAGKGGDVIVIQETGNPVLFVPRTSVAAHLNRQENAFAFIIPAVGANLAEIAVSADASFESLIVFASTGLIRSLTLTYTLPNGLRVAYTTDDALPWDTERIENLKFDFLATESGILSSRAHVQLGGPIFKGTPSTPAQLVCVEYARWQQFSGLILNVVAANVGEDGGKL